MWLWEDHLNFTEPLFFFLSMERGWVNHMDSLKLCGFVAFFLERESPVAFPGQTQFGTKVSSSKQRELGIFLPMIQL